MNPRASILPAARFRAEIATAVASGSAPESLLLNLTLLDATKLKRDPQVPLEDISFSDGEMRYLGVRVKQGGVKSSTLQSDGVDPEDALPAEGTPSTPIPPAKERTRVSKAV